MGLHPEKNWKPETKKFWKEYRKAFEFEIDEIQILKTACRSMDRMLQAAELIDHQGLTFVTKTGTIHKNPATLIEKDSRAALLQALKLLNSRKSDAEKKLGRPLSDAGLGLI